MSDDDTDDPAENYPFSGPLTQPMSHEQLAAAFTHRETLSERLKAALAWRGSVELQLREWLRLMDDAETPDEIAWVVASVSERIRAVLAGGEELAVLVRKLAQAGLSEGNRG